MEGRRLKREDIFLQTKFGINIDFSDPNNVHATRYDFSAKHLITRLDEELEASALTTWTSRSCTGPTP